MISNPSSDIPSNGSAMIRSQLITQLAVVRPGSIDDDEETLAEIRAWMVERLLKFKQVFGPRLDELVV